AAYADPLNHAQERQQHRRRWAQLFVRREQADEHSTHAHEEQCGHQRRLAADPIAQVAEEDPAQRPGDEARGEGEERKDLADELALLGEEQPREDEGRRRAVEEEVVPLDGGAHGTGDHRFHQRPLLVGGACLGFLLSGHGVFDGSWDRYYLGIKVSYVGRLSRAVSLLPAAAGRLRRAALRENLPCRGNTTGTDR